MRRVLVTGGSGLLGSTVATAATDRYDVTATYHSNPVSLSGVDCREADLTDSDRVATVVDEGLDAVIHCAALTDVDRCEREPGVARSLNVGMTEHLVDAASEAGARFVYLSTDAVFDGEGRFYTESSKPDPINSYGETKLAGERRVLSRHDDSVVVRTNIYGWNVTAGQSLAEWILDRLGRGETIPAFTDVYVTPIYTGHLAACLLEIADGDLTGRLHVAGTERCNKYQFALTVADVFDREASLVIRSSIADQDFDAPRGRDLSLSVERACELLDCPLPDLRGGLERMRREEP